MRGQSNKKTTCDPMEACINGGLITGIITPNGQLYVYQGHAYSEYSQIAPHQFSAFLIEDRRVCGIRCSI